MKEGFQDPSAEVPPSQESTPPVSRSKDAGTTRYQTPGQKGFGSLAEQLRQAGLEVTNPAAPEGESSADSSAEPETTEKFSDLAARVLAEYAGTETSLRAHTEASVAPPQRTELPKGDFSKGYQAGMPKGEIEALIREGALKPKEVSGRVRVWRAPEANPSEQAPATDISSASETLTAPPASEEVVSSRSEAEGEGVTIPEPAAEAPAPVESSIAESTPGDTADLGSAVESPTPVVHIPYHLRNAGEAGTMPAEGAPEPVAESVVTPPAEIVPPAPVAEEVVTPAPEEVAVTPPAETASPTPETSPAPYTEEDLQAYLGKEKNAAEAKAPEVNPVYAEKDLQEMLGKNEQEPVEKKPDPFEGVPPETRRAMREMLYKMNKGVSTADPEGLANFTPAEQVELAALEVYKHRKDLMERYEKMVIARKAMKKSGGKEHAAEYAEAKIWHENANMAFEQTMDELKREMLRDFLAKKKEAYPKLTKKQLEKEALQYSSQFVLEAAQNQYQQVADLEAAVVDEHEKGRLRRMMESYAKWPKGRRLALSATIGVGAATGGALLFGAGGIVAATSYGAWRGVRALVGGGSAMGMQELVERGYTKKKYGKERVATRAQQWAETEANLASQITEGEAWLEDQEKLLELMSIVDGDAKKYKEKLDGIAKKESRTRAKSAILTGLAGGVIANLDNLYGSAEHLFGHTKEAGVGIIPVPVKGGTAPLEATPLSAHAISPEDALKQIQELGERHATTIPRGSSLWETTRGMMKHGDLTQQEWQDAWKNSTVEILHNGKPKMVPISEVGLVHPGDQVEIVKDAAGHVRFQVHDLVKDHLPMGGNQMYYEALKKSGKSAPRWLEDALHIKHQVKTPIEHASNVLGPDKLRVEGTTASVLAETRNPISKSEMIYAAIERQEVATGFRGSNLLQQETVIHNLDQQRESLLDGLAHANTPQEVQLWTENLKNLEALRTDVVLAPEYLQHLQELRGTLLEHGVKLDLFEKVGGIKVNDFQMMALGRGRSLLGTQFEAFQDVARSRIPEIRNLAALIGELSPGKLERQMTVAEFLKSSIS